MGARSTHNRSKKNYIKANSKLFFNCTDKQIEQLRYSVNKFAHSDKFTFNCAYYDVVSINGKLEFNAIGKPLYI